jgi:hypothetical protein
MTEAPDLDCWIPDPAIRTRQRRSADAAAERLWHEAERVRVCDAPVLGRAVRWRIPDTPSEITFRDLFRRYPFVVLDEGEDWSVSGLCGRIWTLRRDYPRIEGAADFRDWDEPGTVRVVIANWVDSGEGGACALVSESRVEPTDRRAQIRLRALWAVVGRFERLVGGEALKVAARRAENGR